MILAPKCICLALSLLLLCSPAHSETESHSLRGGAEAEETPRALTGVQEVTINFDEVPAGTYVSNQYNSAQYPYSLVLSSQGPGALGTLPRTFDTNNPTSGEYGDIDLGSPNEHCPGGGPGWGEGGEPGTPGENCVPLHNVLIIQEDNGKPSVPDDNAEGGKIFFDFVKEAPFVFEMAFLDNDYGGKLIVEHGAGTTSTIQIPLTGDNGYGTVSINKTNVRRITVDLVRSGAVVFIRFTPAQPDPEPEVPVKIEIPYDLVSVIEVDTCFDPIAWCELELFEILMNLLDGEGLSPEELDVYLNGLQALFCDAATSALASSMAVVRGGGKFTLTSSGCCSQVSHISLDVSLDTAVMALAEADASASATADAGAWAYAFAKTTVCSKYASHTLRYKLCALAKGEASSEAVAVAEATGAAAASALAGAGTSTDVSVFVDADKINEFSALIATSAASFAAASAEASARAYASAYARALAVAKVQATIQKYHCCRHKKRRCDHKCHWGRCKCHYYWTCMHCDWWTQSHVERFLLLVERASSDAETSYASAYARAMASVSVNAIIPAYFKEQGANDDIIWFHASDDHVEVDVSTQCIA